MDPYRNDQEAQLQAAETLKRENDELVQENQALRSANETLRSGGPKTERSPEQALVEDTERLHQTILRSRFEMKAWTIGMILLVVVANFLISYLSDRR